MDDDRRQDRTDIPVPAPDPMPVPEPVPELAPTANAWRELGEVLWLSFPIIMTMLSYTAMQFADVMMVGWHSRSELSAVGAASSCLFLIGSLLMGTLSIANTFVGQSVGRGRPRDGPRYVWQAVYLALVWGAVALLLGPLAPVIFAWGGHAPHIQHHEITYFTIGLFRLAPVGLIYGLSAFYQATKRPVVPMAAAIAGGIVNVALNYILIFGKLGLPEMGIRGAALATVLASCFQAVLIFGAFLSRPTHRVYGSRTAWDLDLGKMWRMIRFGIPAGLTWSLENASWTLFVMKVIGSLGEDALAAQNATIQILHMSFMPVIGLNIGIQAIVGQHIGMGDHDGAKRRAYRALAVGVGFMVFMGIMFVLFRRPLIGLFCRRGTGEGIIRMGGTMLIFAAMFQAFDALFIMSYGALKGAGDTRFPMFVTIACNWLMFIPLAMLFVFVLKMGVAGAWLAVTLYIAVAGCITFRRLAGDAWRRIDIFKAARGQTSAD